MDAVLTLNDWWDGPLLGIATYGEETCIYERIFSEQEDDYLNQYYLTPISSEQRRQIIVNWEEWLQWMVCAPTSKRAEQWHDSGKHLDLESIARHSPDYRKYIKGAEFCGNCPQNFYSGVKNYYVIWKQP